jgi:hypothetical protein
MMELKNCGRIPAAKCVQRGFRQPLLGSSPRIRLSRLLRVFLPFSILIIFIMMKISTTLQVTPNFPKTPDRVLLFATT